MMACTIQKPGDHLAAKGKGNQDRGNLLVLCNHKFRTGVSGWLSTLLHITQLLKGGTPFYTFFSP